jgi:hypothetical protein
LIRNTFRLASRRDWDALKRGIKPIYTAVNATAARAALDELAEKWGQRCPAIIRLWENAWDEFIPFLDYDIEIRQVICSTNAIVISSRPADVVHVRHGRVGSRDLRGGRGYLPLVHHVDHVLEERCTFSGWRCPSRAPSRGRCWVTTMSRSSRWNGSWLTSPTSSGPRTPSRHMPMT